MKNQNLAHFPSEEVVLKGIEYFRKFKWLEFNNGSDIESHIKTITDKLGDFFNIIPDLLYIHHENTEFPFNFFRARPSDTFSDRHLISEYKYTPINLTTGIQRCNFPHKPVFYCSNDVGTAIMELIRNQPFNKERNYLVSKWIKEPNIKTKIVPFLFNKLPEQNYYRILGDKALSSIPDIFQKNLNKSQVKGLRLYLQFLSEAFLTENYSLSASLAHRILYANHNYRADMFVYPSVQLDHKSVNIAIHPNYVDTCMKIERIYSINVEKIDKKKGEFKIIINKYAEVENSRIVWKSLNIEDLEYQKSVRKDFNFEDNFEFKEHKYAL